jgi:hypothetical protein
MQTNYRPRKFILERLRNQRGDALVVAMVMIATCMVSSLMMMTYGEQIEAGSKRPRIKSMMSSVEAKVRAVLLTPSSYLNCTSSDTVSVRNTCDLNVNAVTSLSRVIKDVKCPPTKPSCGILVKLVSFQKSLDVSGQRVSRADVQITYEGIDYPLKAIDVVMDVPADILQSSGVYQCPTTKPQFNGFNADGTMNCQAMSPRLGANEFVVSVDKNGLTTTKGTLPAADLACGTNEYFDDVKWTDGGMNIYSHCAPRLDPFTTFGFTPKVAPAGDVSYVPAP